MDRNTLQSLEKWIGDNPNVLPESIIESLMSAASTSEEADLATGESGVSAGSSQSQSGADSISGKHKSSTNTLAIIVMHE